jgi:hypothetical protein
LLVNEQFGILPMWRKTACAVAGTAVALAAAYGLTSTETGATGRLFDLTFLYPQHSNAKAKGDRLPVSSAAPASAFAISFNLPEQATTVVAKNPSMPAVVTSVRFPRDPAPAYSVRPQQPEMAQKPKLPEGCEPSFSPVTVPSMAHIAGRCAS